VEFLMSKRLKRAVSIMCVTAVLLVSSSGVFAYNFPEPDWGALLNERKQMVMQNEFELYTEAGYETAPFYGARLEPRGGTFMGMVAENSKGFSNIGSYLTYVEGMEQDDLYYPANEMVSNDNVMTMVGWTITDMNSVDYNQVRKVLDNLARYNKPMLIRFANEMNESQIGMEPEIYKQVFRDVANMIHEYDNFAVVWSPNDMGALDRPYDYYYPGDEYVDWVGISCYPIKYFQGDRNTDYKNSVYFMTGDYAWATNRVKLIVDFMRKNNISKPLMISEGGVTTNNNYGEDMREWGSPRLRNMLWYLVMKYPQIKMINYFNTRRDYEDERFEISDYGYAKEIFNEAAENGPYIKNVGYNSDFVFAPASRGEALAAKNGIVNLYTYAYIAETPNITVNYSVDGNWIHSSNEIPYKCGLDISGIADGEHTLSIWCDNMQKDYTFYKSGGGISFGQYNDMLNNIENTQNTNDEISVILDGRKLLFDQPPIIADGRTLVPLRAIFEGLGAEVLWDDATKTVTASKGGVELKLTIGENRYFKNGNAFEMDTAARIVNGRTLVPVRMVSENFGKTVNWDGNTKTVTIS